MRADQQVRGLARQTGAGRRDLDLAQNRDARQCAAQLVGVPRGVLQQRVRRGEIALQDGLVSTDTLLALYPQAELESQGLFERVTQIREDAFARRLRERLLPSQEVLAQRLFRQGQELADTQRHLQRFHALVIGLRDRIRAHRADEDDPRLQDLERQLNDGLARALAFFSKARVSP